MNVAWIDDIHVNDNVTSFGLTQRSKGSLGLYKWPRTHTWSHEWSFIHSEDLHSPLQDTYSEAPPPSTISGCMQVCM